MTRGIYQLIIRMHPPGFRQRFGDEMMSIFDETIGCHTYALVVDAVMSFTRQWLLRTGVWKLVIALAAAFLQLLGFGYVCKGLRCPAGRGEAPMASMDQVLFFALALTCCLFIVIMFLILWNTRFQRRRLAAYKPARKR